MKTAIFVGLILLEIAISGCANSPISHVFDHPHDYKNGAPQSISDHLYDNARPQFTEKFFRLSE